MFIPVRSSNSTTDVIVVDKEIITEGDIKQDSIIMTKKYLSKKESNYKKKFLSKTTLIKSSLIYKPNLKGVLLKENEYSDYSALIISN
jgi:cytochrome c-type biogenesis protein CcmE